MEAIRSDMDDISLFFFFTLVLHAVYRHIDMEAWSMRGNDKIVWRVNDECVCIPLVLDIVHVA